MSNTIGVNFLWCPLVERLTRLT